MVTTPASQHESNRSFYDRISESYDLIADANERKARLVGLDALDLKPNEQVLEVGFGTGNEIIDLANKVGPGGKVCGIDISPGMLKVAERKLKSRAVTTPVDLRVSDARELPYEKDAFDAGYSTFTLELFPEDDIPIVLSELHRVLRPSGRLAVVSMAKVKSGHSPSALERTYIWMHRHFPHIVDCRPIDVVSVLTAAGFHARKQIDLEIWTMPVSAVVATKE